VRSGRRRFGIGYFDELPDSPSAHRLVARILRRDVGAPQARRAAASSVCTTCRPNPSWRCRPILVPGNHRCGGGDGGRALAPDGGGSRRSPPCLAWLLPMSGVGIVPFVRPRTRGPRMRACPLEASPGAPHRRDHLARTRATPAASASWRCCGASLAATGLMRRCNKLSYQVDVAFAVGRAMLAPGGRRASFHRGRTTRTISPRSELYTATAGPTVCRSCAGPPTPYRPARLGDECRRQLIGIEPVRRAGPSLPRSSPSCRDGPAACDAFPGRAHRWTAMMAGGLLSTRHRPSTGGCAVLVC